MLPVLYLPSCIAGVLQWSLDKSTLFTQVTSFADEKQVEERPRDGCYITGLFLEGASWDLGENCLKPQDPKVLVVPLPILQVIPIESNKLKLQNTFKTPVYVTQVSCDFPLYFSHELRLTIPLSIFLSRVVDFFVFFAAESTKCYG